MSALPNVPLVQQSFVSECILTYSHTPKRAEQVSQPTCLSICLGLCLERESQTPLPIPPLPIPPLRNANRPLKTPSSTASPRPSDTHSRTPKFSGRPCKSKALAPRSNRPLIDPSPTRVTNYLARSAMGMQPGL